MSRKYDWPALLEAQAKSGLTQAEFCRQHDVCAKYFSTRKSQASRAASAAQAEDEKENAGKAGRFVVSANPTPPLPSFSR